MEDGPAELDRYRLKALEREFAQFSAGYSPYANLYAIVAQFVLNKLHQAEGTTATNVLMELAR